jgi:hypothetical protein
MPRQNSLVDLMKKVAGGMIYKPCENFHHELKFTLAISPMET